MKLNFTIRVPQRDMQKLVNLALESQQPEFTYEITKEGGQPNMSEIAEIRRIVGLDQGSEFPNKLKSMYEDQIQRLRSLASSLATEVDITKTWFEQIKNSVFKANNTELDKFKSLYQVVQNELDQVKKIEDLELPPGDGKSEAHDPLKLTKQITVLQSEVKIRDARIASLIAIEEQVKRLEYEKQNYQSELALLKARSADQRFAQNTASVQVQKTRTVQQTTVTESLTKTLQIDSNSSSQQSKVQNLLLGQLNDALAELKVQRARNFELEFQVSQLRQTEEFLRIKTEEVEKLKKILDEQNLQILTLNKKNEENANIIDRLNKKITDLNEHNLQLTTALEQKSEKNKKLMEHIDSLERICAEAKLKNEALIKRINDLEDEVGDEMETAQERMVASVGATVGMDHGRETVLGGQLMRKNQEIQELIKKGDEARKEIAGLKLELAGAQEAGRIKDLKMQELNGQLKITLEKTSALNQRIQELSKQNSALQGELMERDKKITELDQKVLALLAEIDRLKAELLEQQKTARDAIAQREQSELEKRSYTEQLTMMERTVSSDKDNHVKIQSRAKELEDEIERLKGVIRQFENNNSPLKAERDQLLIDKKRLTTDNQQLTTENDRIKKELGSLSDKLKSITSDHEELSRKYKQITDKHEATIAEDKLLKKEREALKDKIEKLTKEVEQLTKDKTELTNTLQTVRSENQRLLKEVTDLKTLLKANELKLEEWRAKNANLIQKIDEIVSQNANLSVENQQLKSELANLKILNETLKTERDDFETKLVKAEQERDEANSSLKRVSEELAAKVQEFKRTNDALTARLADQTKRISDLEAELKANRTQSAEAVKSLQNTVNQLKKDLGAIKTENEQLKRQIEVLKAELEARKEDFLKAINSMRAELEKENQSLTDRLHKSELENMNLKSERNAYLQKIEVLERDLAAKNSELDDLRNKNPKNAQVSPSTLEKLKEMNKMTEDLRVLRAQYEAQKKKQELLEKELRDKSEQLAEYLKNPTEILTPEMKDELANINQIKIQMYTISNENDQLRRKNELLEFENKEKAKYLEAANARVYPPNTIEMKDHLDAVGQANNKIAALKAEIEQLKRQAFDLENKGEILRRQSQLDKEGFEAEKKRLSETNESLQKMIAKLKAEIESFQRQLKEAQDQLKKMTEERSKTAVKSGAQGAVNPGSSVDIDELNEKLAERDTMIELLGKDKRNLLKTIEFLKTQIEELNKEPPKWDAIPTIDLSDAIKRDLESLARTKAEMAALQTENEILNRRLQVLEKELEARQKLLAELTGQTDGGGLMRVGDHIRAMTDLAAELSRLQTVNKGLEGKLEMAAHELGEKQAIIAGLVERLRQAYEVEMGKLAEELNQTRFNAESTLSENNALKRKVEMLESELAGAAQKIKELSEILRDYSGKVDILTREKIERETKESALNEQPIDIASMTQVKSRAESPVQAGLPSEVGQAINVPNDYEQIKAENDRLQQKCADLQAFIDRKVPEYEQRIQGMQRAQTEYEELKNKQIAELKTNLYKTTQEVQEITLVNQTLTSENKTLGETLKRPDTVPKSAYAKLANDLNVSQQQNSELKHQCDKLEAELQIAKNKADEIAKINDKLDAFTKEKTNDIIALEQQLANAKLEIENLKQTISRLQKQSDDKSGSSAPNPLIQEFEAKLANLQKALDSERFENERLKRQLQIKQSEVDEREKQLKLSAALVSDMQTKLDAQITEISEQAKKIAQLESEIASLKDQLTTANQKLQEATQNIATLEAEGKKKDEEIKAEKSAAAAAKNELQEANEKVQNLTTQIQRLKQELQRKEDELKTADEENTRLRQQKNELESNLKAIQTQNDGLTKQVSELQSTLNNAKNELEKAEKTRIALEKQIRDLQNQNENLSEKSLKDDQKIANLEALLAKVNAENEALETKLNATEKQLRTALKDKEKALENVKDLEDQIEKLQAQLNSLTAENSALKSKTAHSEKRVFSSVPTEDVSNQKEIDALKALNDKLRKELDETKAALSQRTVELEKVTWQLTETTADLKKKEQEMDRLSKELQAVSSAGKEARAEIERLTIQINQINDQLRKVETDSKQLKEAKATLEEQLSTKNKEIAKIRSELSDLQKSQMELASQLNQRDTEITILKQSTTKQLISKEDYEKLSAELNTLRQERDRLTAKLDALQRDLSAKDKRLQTEEETFQKALNESKDLIDKLSKSNQEINSLKMEIEAMKAQVVRAKDETENEVSKNNMLKDQLKKLEEQLSKKDAQYSQQQSEIGRLNSELDSLKRQMTEASRPKGGSRNDSQINQEVLAKLTTANEENSRLKSQLEKMSRDLADAQREISDLKNEAGNKASRIQALEKELQTKNAQISELKQEITKVTSRNELLEVKVKNLEQSAGHSSNVSKTSEKSTFMSVLEKEMGSFESMANELNKQKIENESLQKTLAGVKRDLADKGKEMEALKAARDKAERALQEQANQMANSQTGMQKATAESEVKTMKIKSLESEIDMLKRRQPAEHQVSSQVHMESQPDLAPLSALKTEINQVRLELQNSRNKERSLETELATQKESNASLQKKITSLTAELQMANERANQFAAAANQLKTDVDRLSFENNLIAQENQKHRDDVKAMKSTIEQINHQNSGLKTAIDQLKDRIGAFEIELAEKDKEINDIQKELDGKNAEITAANAEIKKVNGERSAMKLEAEKATRRAQGLEDEIVRLRSEMNAQTVEFEKMKSELAAKEKELENEETKVMDLKVENDILKAKIADLEEQEKERRTGTDNVFMQSATSFRNVNTESTTTSTIVDQKLRQAETDFRAQIGNFEGQIAELNDQLGNAKDALARAEKRLKDANASNAALQKELLDIRSEYSKSELKLSSLQSNSEQSAKQLALANNRVKDLTEQLRVKNQRIAQLEDELRTQQERIDELETKQRQFQASYEASKNTAVKSTVSNTSITNTSLNLDMKEYLANLTTLSSEVNELKVELETAKKRQRKAEDDESAKLKQIASLNQNIDNLNQTIRDKTAQNKTQAAELASVKAECEQLKIKVRSLSDDLAQNGKAVSVLNSEVDSLQAELREKVSAINNLNDEIARVKREADFAVQRATLQLQKSQEQYKKYSLFDAPQDDSYAKLKEKTLELEALQAQLTEARLEAENLKRKMTASDDEFKSRERKTKATETRLETIQQELKQRTEAEFKMNSENMQLKSEIDILKFKLNSLQAELDARAATTSPLPTITTGFDFGAKDKQATFALQTELNSVKIESEALKRKLKNYESEIQDKDAQLTALKDKIKTLTDENSSLRKGRVDSAEIERYQRRITELESDLSRERENFANHSRSSASYELQIRSLQAEIDNFRGNKLNLENELKNKSSEIQKLRGELQRAEQQILVNQYNK